MGQFRIEVTAVGGHGCQREVKDGGIVEQACQYPGCPDCAARAFVRGLKAKGNNVETATLTHWPGQPSQVVDDLLTGKRSGSF